MFLYIPGISTIKAIKVDQNITCIEFKPGHFDTYLVVFSHNQEKNLKKLRNRNLKKYILISIKVDKGQGGGGTGTMGRIKALPHPKT